MTSIRDRKKKELLLQLSKQRWVEDYVVTVSEGHTLVTRLLNYAFGSGDQVWDDPDAPVIPRYADLQRISALLKTAMKLETSMNKTKHILDAVDRSLNSESLQQERVPLSTRLQPLLADLVTASEVALHPLSRTRRGAPKKTDQDSLILSTAYQIQRILARRGPDDGEPFAAEVARLTVEVISLVNIHVLPKRVQNLLKRPI